MPVPIQKIREIVLQLLYSYDIAQLPGDETTAFLSQELSLSNTATKEAMGKVLEIWQHHEALDLLIQEISIEYALDRIQKVERNILRLGVYEMLYDEAVPPKVAIAEAMRLAKKYSTPEAVAFVNALLDNIYKKKVGNAG